jgi:hypothetical protein
MKGKFEQQDENRQRQACLFLAGSDQARYQGAINELFNNDFVQGTDNYQRMCRSMNDNAEQPERAVSGTTIWKEERGMVISSTRPLRDETLLSM